MNIVDGNSRRMEYTLIEVVYRNWPDPTQEMIDRVNEKMAEGFVPLGAIVVLIGYDGCTMYQTMVK